MVMGEETLHAELLVIGGGTGGYSAAFHAADLGMKVVLVTDEKRLGGVCLHRGCIPSKALLHPVRLFEEIHRAASWGMVFKKPDTDLEQLREWKDSIVDQLVSGLHTLSERRDIRIIQGRAVFESSSKVKLRESDMVSHIEFKHAIVATGSRPIAIPDTEFQRDSRIMDSKSALELPDIPEKLLVVGGGYIGLELGMVYAALGSEVTLVEMMDSLLPGIDRDLINWVTEKAKEMFAAIHLNTSVTLLEEKDDHVHVEFEGKAENGTFDRVLVAIGRQPNTENLQLDNTNVELEADGFIKVDDERRTTDESIFAVGDVTGEPLLAHKSFREGKVAVEVIAGQPAAYDTRAVPAVIFTEPEIAYCGLMEDEAREQGFEVKVGSFPWQASGRALIKGETNGLTKIVFDSQTERILGVGIVGNGASELIAEGVLAIEMGAVAHDLAASIHPHPTLSETLAEAAEDFINQSIHA